MLFAKCSKFFIECLYFIQKRSLNARSKSSFNNIIKTFLTFLLIGFLQVVEEIDYGQEIYVWIQFEVIPPVQTPPWTNTAFQIRGSVSHCLETSGFGVED